MQCSMALSLAVCDHAIHGEMLVLWQVFLRTMLPNASRWSCGFQAMLPPGYLGILCLVLASDAEGFKVTGGW